MERELLLLGLLRRGDNYGYHLHDFINKYMASCTNLKKATAYYLLDKMVERGWIEQKDDDSDSNYPPRRIYSLTEAGEAAFQKLLRENLSQLQPVYFTGDIGLAFLDVLDAAEARALLQQRYQAVTERLNHLEANAPKHEGAPQWVLEHHMRFLQFELSWLTDLLTRLEGV